MFQIKDKISRCFLWARHHRLWTLFIWSLVFCGVGNLLLYQVDVRSEFGVNGEKPAAYAKDRAAARAMAKLVRYAEANHIPVYQFKGPYFSVSLGLDFPTYVVTFKHPKHYFIYDDWTGNIDSDLNSLGVNN